MHFLIRLTHFEQKPSFSITLLIKHHSTLSEVLLISSLTAIKPYFPIVLWFRKCISSMATSTLSVIRRSGVNALWFSKMMRRRRFLSLLARVLEISFLITLHRLMGLNLVIFFRLLVFGMREMLFLLISVIGKLLLRTFRTILVTLSNISDKK